MLSSCNISVKLIDMNPNLAAQYKNEKGVAPPYGGCQPNRRAASRPGDKSGSFPQAAAETD